MPMTGRPAATIVASSRRLRWPCEVEAAVGHGGHAVGGGGHARLVEPGRGRRSRPPRRASRWRRSRTSAMGERHWLAVQRRSTSMGAIVGVPGPSLELTNRSSRRRPAGGARGRSPHAGADRCRTAEQPGRPGGGSARARRPHRRGRSGGPPTTPASGAAALTGADAVHIVEPAVVALPRPGPARRRAARRRPAARPPSRAWAATARSRS